MLAIECFEGASGQWFVRFQDTEANQTLMTSTAYPRKEEAVKIATAFGRMIPVATVLIRNPTTQEQMK